MLSTPHIGRKRNIAIDQVKIYFVDAKQCQGIGARSFQTSAFGSSLQISLFQACDEDAFASLK